MADSRNLDHEEMLQDVAVLVAEWLLLDCCSKRAAAERLHEVAGSMREARSLVGFVHATLKSTYGRSYKRLPKEDRLANLEEIEVIICASSAKGCAEFSS